MMIVKTKKELIDALQMAQYNSSITEITLVRKSGNTQYRIWREIESEKINCSDFLLSAEYARNPILLSNKKFKNTCTTCRKYSLCDNPSKTFARDNKKLKKMITKLKKISAKQLIQ